MKAALEREAVGESVGKNGGELEAKSRHGGEKLCEKSEKRRAGETEAHTSDAV